MRTGYTVDDMIDAWENTQRAEALAKSSTGDAKAYWTSIAQSSRDVEKAIGKQLYPNA